MPDIPDIDEKLKAQNKELDLTPKRAIISTLIAVNLFGLMVGSCDEVSGIKTRTVYADERVWTEAYIDGCKYDTILKMIVPGYIVGCELVKERNFFNEKANNK